MEVIKGAKDDLMSLECESVLEAKKNNSCCNVKEKQKVKHVSLSL